MGLLKKLIPVKFNKVEKLVNVNYIFFNKRYIPTKTGVIKRYIPVRYKSIPTSYKPK